MTELYRYTAYAGQAHGAMEAWHKPGRHLPIRLQRPCAAAKCMYVCMSTYASSDMIFIIFHECYDFCCLLGVFIIFIDEISFAERGSLCHCAIE